MSLKVKLTLIAEGSTKWQRLIRRWGVSYLLGDDVIFDTFGRSDVFQRSIKKLCIDTKRIKHIVLSHDDWDHIAGLWYLLNNRIDITVYICPGTRQEIKDRIASFGSQIVEMKNATLIKEVIYSTGELYGESKGRKIYEQSVVIKATNGLAVICGCAHPGIVGIVRSVKETFHENVSSLVGGFHLKDNTDEINLRIAQDLREIGVRQVAPMHCTGTNAVQIMRMTFGDGFRRLREGDEIEI